jgi:hypothetical protein
MGRGLDNFDVFWREEWIFSLHRLMMTYHVMSEISKANSQL